MSTVKPSKRIAVVGSGAGALGAMYALSSTSHEVHLFEADSYFGGHCYTYQHEEGNLTAGVDLGFLSFNEVTYPNFYRAMKHLGVQFNRPPNSMSVTRDNGAFEYSSSNILAQKSNIFSRSFWRLLFDVVRFNQIAQDVLIEESQRRHPSEKPHMDTFDDFLKRHHFSEQFRDDYLVPTTSLIWSTDVEKVRKDFPMAFLIKYLWNHHLISFFEGHQWYSIQGGSQNYVNAVLERFPSDRLHLNSTVLSASNDQKESGVWLEIGNLDGTSRTEHFDHVILGCHAPQALKIIQPNITSEEHHILSAFRTTSKEIVCHSDTSLLPTRPSAWSSWNHTTHAAISPSTDPVRTVSCWVNQNMSLPPSKFSTLITTTELASSRPPIDPSKIHHKWSASHPWYTPDAIRGQGLLPQIQNTRGVSYCGAWTGFGLHEDGFTSGMKAAVNFCGGNVPFGIRDIGTGIMRKPRVTALELLLRAMIFVVQWLILAYLRVTGS